MDNTLSLLALRNSAALCLACAVHRICPKAELIEAKATDLGFLCEFSSHKILSQTSLDALEELFRALTAENIPLDVREMLAENAALFLRSKNFPQAAAEALELAGYVVDVVGIGDFWARSPGPHVKESGELRAFQLLSKEEGETIRIRGAVYPDSSALKKFLKAYRGRPEWDSTYFAKERGWIISQGRGAFGLAETLAEAKERLYTLWIEEARRLGARLMSVPCYPVQALPDGGFWATRARVPQEGEDASAEGIKNQPFGEQNLLLSEASDEKIISHLQFLLKFTKIFPFKGEWVLCRYGRVPKKQKDLWKRLENRLRQAAQELRIPLNPESAADEEAVDFSGPRIDFVVRDRLGREWKTAHFGVYAPELDPLESRDPIYLAQSSPFGGVERFIALQLEEGGGALPWSIAPTQVLLTIEDSDCTVAAEDVVKECRERGVRILWDNSPGPLKSKDSLLRSTGCPVAMHIGRRGKKHPVLLVCSLLDENGWHEVLLTEFLNDLKRYRLESQ